MIRGSVRIEGQHIPFNEIANDSFERSPFSAESIEVLEFCRDWLNGLKEISIHTSGSTGTPKLITLGRSQILKSVERTRKALRLNPGDNALCCLNTDYIAGKMMLIRSMEIGMDLHISEAVSNPFKDSKFQKKFSFIALVPYQFQQICSDGVRDQLEKMDCIIIGGAPLSIVQENMVREFRNRTYQTYGMTETVSHIALRQLSPKHQDFFEAMEDISFEVDLDQRLIIQDEHGKLKLQTNDVVELIDERRFRWKGRFDNVVNSGGYKIQTEEVEAGIGKVLSKLGLPLRFILFAKPHEQLGEELNLLIESHRLKFALEEQILDELRTVVSAYSIPKKIYYLKNFQETETGKINRKATVSLLNKNTVE